MGTAAGKLRKDQPWGKGAAYESPLGKAVLGPLWELEGQQRGRSRCGEQRRQPGPDQVGLLCQGKQGAFYP